MDITRALLSVFNAVVRDRDDRMVSPTRVNEKALRAGYFFEPEACTEAALHAVEGLEVNYNSTFYKDVEAVLKRTRFEQLLDQLTHYASTYGTNFSGPAFTQNPTPEALLYKTLTVVRAVSAREMFEMCVELLNGPALKEGTLKPVCEYIAEYLNSETGKYAEDFDIKSISNKEARSALYAACKRMPEEPMDFLRLAVYTATGSGLIINSPELLSELESSAGSSDLCLDLFAGDLPRELTEGLASIFFRFKHIFIALKQGFRNAPDKERGKSAVSYVNYLRRLAPRFKKPYRADVLSSLTAGRWSELDVEEAARAEVSTFRLLRCLGYLRMYCTFPDAKLYLIRNGKAFIRDNYNLLKWNDNAARYAEIIESEIVNRLRGKVDGKTVRFPDIIELSAPTSEKNFVGNVPFMSSLRMGEASYAGIYWREEWGAYDFDLSAVFTADGKKIGWNEDFIASGETVVYSGDMTRANPEASEILYFRRNAPDGMIYVNRYNGESGSKYRLFFGSGDIQEITGEKAASETYSGRGYGVRKMDIVLEADMYSDSKEQLVGFICEGRFYFMSLSTGKGPVSRGKDYSADTALEFRRYSAVSLRSLLLKAGAIERNGSDDAVDLDLSPRALNRSTLINLFNTEGKK